MKCLNSNSVFSRLSIGISANSENSFGDGLCEERLSEGRSLCTMFTGVCRVFIKEEPAVKGRGLASVGVSMGRGGTVSESYP